MKPVVIPFKAFVLKHLGENTPYGDIARDIKRGKCVPYFKKKERVIAFLQSAGTWSDAALSVINSLIDEYQVYVEVQKQELKAYYSK